MSLEPKDLANIRLRLASIGKTLQGGNIIDTAAEDYDEFFVETDDGGWSEDVEPATAEVSPDDKYADIVRRLRGGEVLDRYQAFLSNVAQKLVKRQ